MDKQCSCGAKAMTNFTAILSAQRSRHPSTEGKNDSARLVEALSQSRLHYWTLGDDVASTSRRTLIGVAPYSTYDLKLLEALNELSLDPISERIDIFDVLACHSQEDFEKYISAIGKVYQTPVVGIWQNGKLVQRDSGHNARQLLRIATVILSPTVILSAARSRPAGECKPKNLCVSSPKPQFTEGIRRFTES